MEVPLSVKEGREVPLSVKKRGGRGEGGSTVC